MAIISEDEKKRIYNDLIEAFGREGQMKFSFVSFKDQISNLIQEMKIEKVKKTKFFNNKPITFMSYEMGKEIANRNILAAKGYLLIFKFREYLLNETINYRYYFHDSTGQVQAREFGHNQILDFMNFSERAILVNSNKLMLAEELAAKAELTTKMTEYFNKYTSPDLNPYMKIVGYANLRMVRKKIKEKYAMNKGLLKTGTRKHQVFNEGHIFESLDLALSYWKIHEDEHLNIDDLMFGMFLKRDTVKASKGPDNYFTNTQIKSNSASFYSFNTISNQLYLIKLMLDSKDPNFIKNQIKFLFLDDSQKSSIVGKDVELVAEKALQKLMSSLKQLNTNVKI